MPAAPAMPTNGFSFGQSQSFPGAAPSASEAEAKGSSSPFSFGGGGGASSFNFAAGPSSTTSNPFATMNTTSTSQPPESNGFSGFKGSIFNLPPSSPAQQPMPSGGLFGSTTTTAPSSGPTPTTGLFGSPAPSAAPSTGMFGQTSPQKPPSPVGQAMGGEDSMQTSPDAKGSAASKPSIFSNGNALTPPPSFSFGGSNPFSPAAPAAGQSPSKPLFGAKPAEQTGAAPPSLFGATTPTSSATTTTPPTTSSNMFGGASPAKPADAPANPFQSSNLFSGASAPSADAFKPTQAKGDEEKKPSEPSVPKSPFQFTPSTTNGPSLFSKSEAAAPPAAPSGLFGAKPAFGASQPPSTGNIFAPKPPAPAEQSPAKAPESNPFGSLFAPKPASPAPAPASKPQEEKEQPPAQNPFANIFAPKPSAAPAQEKPGEAAKPATSGSLFSASTPAAGAAKPPSLFQPSTSLFQAPAPTPAAPSQEPPKSNAPEPAPQRIETMQPKGLPADLNKDLKADAGLLHRVHILNDSFKKEITKLDPAKDDFDLAILYYMRVRETIGAPTGGNRQPKRKAQDVENANDGKDVPAQKKVKPFGSEPSSTPATPSAPQMNIAPNSITSTSSKLFGTSQTAESSNKRKADEDQGSPSGDSATASIFAKTFSNSKSSESDKEPGTAEAPKSPVSSPFKPATPESSKVAPVSTTPTTSPSKPLFGSSTTSEKPPASTSLFGQPAPSFTPKSDAAANIFAPKPSENKSAEPAAAPFSMPKFSAGGGTDFFAQFKSKVDNDAEKEKSKRKDEDFDSDEEDEAEWERKDAEKQRKKQEEFASQTQKRAKFVPGKGFVFEDDSSKEATDSKKPEETPATNGPSVFDTKSKSPVKSGNIFGHLSATPSEVEENDGNDTEEASGGEEESSQAESKAISASAQSPANDSSDDGDFGKALKKSKPTAAPEAESTSGSDAVPATPFSSGGSLFDRVQSNKPEGASDSSTPKNPFAGLFNTPKPASSGSTTPSIFAPASSTAAAPSIFSSSTNTTGGGLFGAPAPASTGSLFGASQSPIKPSNDHTWKKDSPIKFATDSASTSKPDSESATPPSEASKPFSTLFGATPAPSSGPSKPTLGFTFGAPSQQTSSVFSSAANSATPSSASTPGASSDAAKESADEDAAEALPQVDLARGGAGEEDEDVLMETRARGLKLKPKEGWDSQGVGFVKILKNRKTSRSRALLRADPSGNIVLNTVLMKDIKYSVSGTNVQFTVPQPDGNMELWALRVKKDEVDRLGSTMEEAKS